VHAASLPPFDVCSAIPKTVKSLTAITPELLVVIVVGAVRCISGTALGEDVSDKLPAYMAARHRLCSTIATAVRDIGYMGDMGYNQLLYPNERDTRRLISWLVGKLPRSEEEDATAVGAGAALTGAAAVRAVLLRNMRSWVIGDASAAPGVSVAAVLRLSEDADEAPAAVPSALPATATSALRAAATYLQEALPDGAGTAATPSAAAATAIVATVGGALSFAPSLQRSAVAAASSSSASSGGGASSVPAAAGALSAAADLDALTARTPGVAAPAPLQPAWRRWMADTAGTHSLTSTYPGAYTEVYSSAFTRAAAFAIPPPTGAGPMALGGASTAAAGETAKTEEEIAAEREAELAAMNARVESLNEDISRLAEQFRLLATSLPGLKESLREAGDKKLVVEQRYFVRKACLDMLPEAAANIDRLTGEVALAADKLIALAEEWETHRLPLVAHIHSLLADKAAQEGTVAELTDSITGVRSQMTALAADMAAKEDAVVKMSAEWERLKEQVPTLTDPTAGAGAPGEVATRPVYTRRIMDIIRQIRKQKAEIGRIVKDVRVVQQEIIVISDKLGRTAAVTTETMERAAADHPKEPGYRQALGQLLRLQELFNQLITTVMALGHAENEIRQVENRAEQLSARNDARNIDALMTDLATIRADNAALEGTLGKAGVAGGR